MSERGIWVLLAVVAVILLPILGALTWFLLKLSNSYNSFLEF